MICEGCKYAEWVRNKAGALHPSGQGKCTWVAPLITPGSFDLRDVNGPARFHLPSRTTSFKIEGDIIERKDGGGWPKECQVREKAE